MRAALATVPGVQKVDVDFEGERATVHVAKSEENRVPEMVAALEGEGFKSWDVESEHKKQPTP